ncbi:hypothetical protein A2U01_0066715, partial [Trifolium medium]|nr:hypothetical protein [Trifolium medium]
EGKKKEVNAGHDPVAIRIPLELDINVKGDVAEIKVVKEKVEVKPLESEPKPSELPKPPDCGGMEEILDMVESVVG